MLDVSLDCRPSRPKGNTLWWDNFSLSFKLNFTLAGTSNAVTHVQPLKPVENGSMRVPKKTRHAMARAAQSQMTTAGVDGAHSDHF